MHGGLHASFPHTFISIPVHATKSFRINSHHLCGENKLLKECRGVSPLKNTFRYKCIIFVFLEYIPKNVHSQSHISASRVCVHKVTGNHIYVCCVCVKVNICNFKIGSQHFSKYISHIYKANLNVLV